VADGAPAPSSFDAVLVVSPASDAPVAGLRLVERAAFTLSQAGARRLLWIGPPPTPTLRLPTLATAWAPDSAAPAVASWIASALPSVIVLDAATVVDPATVASLAAVPGDGTLTAPGPATLHRAPRTQVVDLLRTLVDADSPVGVGASPHSPTGTERWTPPPGALLVRAHDADGRAAATRALYARLGRAGDGWFTRLVDRRISRGLTRMLLPTGVHPNTVTLASIAIGILAGGLFATGGFRACVAGALLFLASTIVDGCDGELARLTFRESRFGARLDVIGDNVVHVAVFCGIAFGLYRHAHDPRVALAGAALVAGLLASMIAVYATFVRRKPNARQRALFETFASREFAYLLVVLTLAGKLEWFLWLSALGTYAFVIGLVALRR
jgi:phosphatidylglycerophosphate synthase